MSNVITVSDSSLLRTKEKGTFVERVNSLFNELGNCASLILIAIMFIVGTVLAISLGIPIKSVMSNYSYDVLVILIVMELFTNLIAETGIMQLFAIKIAEMSKGRKRACLVMFGTMMFLISSCLNNITAVMMILPIVFVLLKTLEVDKHYVYIFFAAILALSNTGGAASPLGDFLNTCISTFCTNIGIYYCSVGIKSKEREG